MIIVFTGPTLSPEEAGKILDAVCLPPVSQGDIYRAAQHRPFAIGIIDGYFDQIPSVWHKEILWAISQGIRVIGASSMGALRAAELSAFGMVGVGRIYDAFHDGVLDDDDEVAVWHGPADTGYKRLSEAMVNIRETLTAAVRCGVISEPTRELLERLAKKLYYADRSYSAILSQGRIVGGLPAELDALATWLPSGRIDQKRLDALALLDILRRWESDATGPPPSLPEGEPFEHTALWDELRRSAGRLTLADATRGQTLQQERLLDEVRLSATMWQSLYRLALARRFGLEEAARLRLPIDEEHTYRAILRFRSERGMYDVAKLTHWLKDNHISEGEFLRLMEKEAALRELDGLMRAEVAAELIDELRLNGCYPEFAERATAKGGILADIDRFPPERDLYAQALEWFFKRLGRPAEPLEEEAHAHGFEDVDGLRRAVLGEYLYCTWGRADGAC